MKKITRENICKHLIEYQLSLVDKTWEDALKDDLWYFNYTLTEKQFEEFKIYSIKLIQKIFKCNKTRALKTFDWFNMSFGLKNK